MRQMGWSVVHSFLILKAIDFIWSWLHPKGAENYGSTSDFKKYTVQSVHFYSFKRTYIHTFPTAALAQQGPPN